MTDDELVRSARQTLEEVLRIDGAPIFARLFRWPRQTPQYDVGHLDRLAAIERRLLSIPGVFVTGSGFRAAGIPDCIADARQVATAAAEYLARA
jgi:oxygen-dependent protoporphyrinogen oxidase